MKRTASFGALRPRPARYRRRLEALFALAGVEIDGPNAWDIRVHHEEFHARVLANGSLGLGESYMEGWWDARDLDGLLYRLIAADLDEKVKTWRDALAWLTASLINLQRRARAFDVGRRHYDLGNPFYEGMLDRRMIYSCAFWENARTLDEAQESKLELTLGKLGLERGQCVLDVGCGWGGALRYAVERFGVSGVGITVAREQAAYARAANREMPIDIRVQDYRELREQFDHVYSIGMFEHVGVRNYRKYMRVIQRCLKTGGRFLLHTIGQSKSVNHTDPWIDKYIFPNSMIPSRAQIEASIRGLFSIRGWQDIGPHYERTLLAWRANFERSWPRMASQFDDRFQRMWRYYLCACAAAFRAKKLEVWQVLLEPAAAA